MELYGIGTTRRRCTIGVIPHTGREYRLKRSVSKDLTVGSLSNFFTCFLMVFSIEFCGLRTTRQRRPVEAFPPTGPEYRRKMFVSKIRPLDRGQIFSLVSRGCFPWSYMESALPADGVRSGPFHRMDQSTGSKSPYLKI